MTRGMIFKGTPGPWCFEPYGSSTRSVIGFGPGVFCSESLTNHKPSKEEMKFNASLVEAAPELLEALVELQSWCQGYENKIQNEMAVKYLDKARAAIAKALGEQK